MDNKSYNAKDKAKEILNVLKENDVNLKNIDYQELEKLLKESCNRSK